MPAAPVMPSEMLLPTPADSDIKDTQELASSSQILIEFDQQTEFIPLDASPFAQEPQEFTALEEYAYPVLSQSPKLPNSLPSPEQPVHPSSPLTSESPSQSLTNSCQPSSCSSPHTNGFLEVISSPQSSSSDSLHVNISPEADSSPLPSSLHSAHANSPPKVDSPPQSPICHSPHANSPSEAGTSPQSSSPQLSPRMIPCPPLTPLPAAQSSTSLAPKIPPVQLSSPHLPTPHISTFYAETPQPASLLPSSITSTTLEPLQPCTAT